MTGCQHPQSSLLSRSAHDTQMLAQMPQSARLDNRQFHIATRNLQLHIIVLYLFLLVRYTQMNLQLFCLPPTPIELRIWLIDSTVHQTSPEG
ncbi:hypothetical protein M433DRAFT_139452 [Acidomyces richmondensis BFW]|nr:MAG: hypothetical protein FE78DRAFT_78059 [Acidomyces sp. 'richmondensis']KYG50129.1 hypothetical protein M433DRAFT_139452 [Acidomyces richmondensis BFW]